MDTEELRAEIQRLNSEIQARNDSGPSITKEDVKSVTRLAGDIVFWAIVVAGVLVVLNVFLHVSI